MDILKCEGVRKVYGLGDNQVTALDGIDLSVSKGEFAAIVGASGSGKIHIASYSWKCGQTLLRESFDRGERYLHVKSNAGSNLPAQKGGLDLSVL